MKTTAIHQQTATEVLHQQALVVHQNHLRHRQQSLIKTSSTK